MMQKGQREGVRMAQAMQEARGRGATGPPPQQPGWAQPSGAHCLFLAAPCEPSRPQCKPEMAPGGAVGEPGQGWCPPGWGGVEGGGAEFQFLRRQEGQVIRTHTPVLVLLKAALEETGREGEKKTHTHLFLYKVSYLIWS